ncbi:hypothetical protein H4S07_000644 [Coemansia furcata]|uniref:Uncharacterized protein n=1 Tax=Coemansia furcata TaxID=417177 RepID=A0ACC1LQW3_9FUNG|nr:hypothetical protein H4S07_000644 [Coemansia furcata]
MTSPRAIAASRVVAAKPPPATFQTLPMLLVYKIVEYLEGRSKCSFDLDIDKHNRLKAVLIPLLSVSECWRKAALESICDNCAFDFDHPRETREMVFPAWPTDFHLTRLRNTNLAKRIVVSVTLGRTLMGTAAGEVITWLLRGGAVAPAARTMLLCLRKANDQVSSAVNGTLSTSVLTSPIVLYSVDWFARFLLRLAPAVTDLVVSVPSINAAQSDHLRLCGPLILALCKRGVKSLHTYSVHNTVPITLHLLGVSGLTSITNGVNIVCAPFARLIHLNARTLRIIDFGFATEGSWRTMIYGSTETPAVYTSLTMLTLTVIDVDYDTAWAAIDDVASFPVLSMLHVDGRYPFDDGLLFKGNEGTLHNIRLPFKAIERSTLVRFGIFKCGRVSQMNSVSIGSIDDMEIELIADRDEVQVRQQVHHILETATKFRITNDIFYTDSNFNSKMFKAIEVAPSTSILQHLYLGVRLEVFALGVINLITAIPSLVSMACCLGDDYLAAKVDPESTYPSGLRSTQYPLSSNFRVLRVYGKSNTSAVTVAKIAMLVAVACPNFTHVDIDPELRNMFSREIAWGMCSRPFEPYADSIRRLIYKE